MLIFPSLAPCNSYHMSRCLVHQSEALIYNLLYPVIYVVALSTELLTKLCFLLSFPIYIYFFCLPILWFFRLFLYSYGLVVKIYYRLSKVFWERTGWNSHVKIFFTWVNFFPKFNPNLEERIYVLKRINWLENILTCNNIHS